MTAAEPAHTQAWGMNVRLHPVLAVVLAAACSDPGNLNPVPAPEDPSRVGDAPRPVPARTPTGTDLQAARHLAEALADDAARADEPDPRTRSDAWAAFYAPDAVHTVSIEIGEEAYDDIASDGRTWVPAVVTVDGLVFPNAGVRRKGNTTWQSMSGKPSLKIKFHEFGEGPELVGLERLTLNNMVSDPSQARENIALRLWQALGTEASRSSWAQVTINGEPYGLYSNIESLDDEWLQRRYVAYGGDFWEMNDDADFSEAGLPWWELTEGEGTSSTLEAITAVLDEGVTSFEGDLGPYVDMEQFLHFWATCLVTGAADGYPFKLNDAYAYGDPADGGRLDFVPWSMDEAWGDAFSTWTAGRLARACRDDDACEARRLEVFDEMLGKLESLDVQAMVADSYATSASLVAEDPRRPFTMAEVSAARAALAARIAGWPARIRTEVQ